MNLAHLCYWIAGAIGFVMILMMGAFWGASIIRDVAGSRLVHILIKLPMSSINAMVALVSWPVRFFTYRSGHGRHAAFA